MLEIIDRPQLGVDATHRVFIDGLPKGRLKNVSACNATRDALINAELFAQSAVKGQLGGYVPLFREELSRFSPDSGDPEYVIWQGDMEINQNSVIQVTFFSTTADDKLIVRLAIET